MTSLNEREAGHVPANEVRLRGRLAGAVEARVLPSGDEIVLFRVVVPRASTPHSRVSVDTIDAVGRLAAVRRRLLRCEAGDTLEVLGALHRRFWRGPAGPASRYEVEARQVRVLVRAAAG